MSFLSLVFRGLLRRPVRTGLTLVGISIGIAAVVALVGMSRGFESSWTAGLKTRGTDVVVNNMRGTLTPKSFPEDVSKRLAGLPGIDSTCNLLVELMSVETAEMTVVSGREWGGFSWENLKLLSGRMPHDGHEKALLLGSTVAEVLKKKVGDTVQLETEELPVIGIFDGGAVVENGSIVLSLSVLQQVMDSEGKINIIDIHVTPGSTDAQIRQVCDEISKKIPEARAQVAGEHIRSSQGYRVIRAMSWGTSLLAVLVGVLGVMNTMLMTVSERKQEISILLALGWHRSRIVRMVLWESALLGLLGGIAGVTLGVIGTTLLQKAPAIRGMLQPELSFALLSISVAIAVLVGVVSGLYPAWRSSRLSPALALQG
jgi:putative ABC transport system permease protein